jgi:hypothetical protein
VDVEEDPGTYRAVWACGGALLFGVLAIVWGALLARHYPGLGASTIVVGAAAAVFMGLRLWARAPRWASQGIILLGIYTWYSPHILGVDPVVGELSRLGIAWGHIGLGTALLFLGVWGALGAPGPVEYEPFFYRGTSVKR